LAPEIFGNPALEGAEKRYPTLNELGGAIGAKSENAWKNWFFLGDGGKPALLDKMQDVSKVRNRNRVAVVTSRTSDELGL
jgi:hypothetical protein